MDIKRRMLEDMAVKLADEFDQNFRRKAFFTKRWLPSKHGLIKTGTLRRSIKATVEGDGVRFTSQVPYAVAHNEGFDGTARVRAHRRRLRKTGKEYAVKAHSRRFSLPQRQFVGDGPDTRRIVKECVDRAVEELGVEVKRRLTE